MSCVLSRWMLKPSHKERAVGLKYRILTGSLSRILVSWSRGRGHGGGGDASTSPTARCHMSQTSEIGGTALYLQGGRHPGRVIKPPPPPPVHLQRFGAAFVIRLQQPLRLEKRLRISGSWDLPVVLEKRGQARAESRLYVVIHQIKLQAAAIKRSALVDGILYHTFISPFQFQSAWDWNAALPSCYSNIMTLPSYFIASLSLH